MAEKEADSGKPKTILIADDDKNLALLYEQELTDEGYAVEVVHDGRSAIERVEAGGIDLLVLDIRMPGMDGIEAFSHIIGKHPNFPTIFNTSYSNYKDDFMTWAADAYVVKSSDMTELKETIKDVLLRRETES